MSFRKHIIRIFVYETPERPFFSEQTAVLEKTAFLLCEKLLIFYDILQGRFLHQLHGKRSLFQEDK